MTRENPIPYVYMSPENIITTSIDEVLRCDNDWRYVNDRPTTRRPSSDLDAMPLGSGLLVLAYPHPEPDIIDS